jgi:NAD-dependent DNA ligase
MPQSVRGIAHYASRGAMDIEGLNERPRSPLQQLKVRTPPTSTI